MSDRIVILNYTPSGEAFGWADAIVHPRTSDEELRSIAGAMSWRSPLKVSLPAREPVPANWGRLQRLWKEEWDFEEREYQVREDDRCITPVFHLAQLLRQLHYYAARHLGPGKRASIQG